MIRDARAVDIPAIINFLEDRHALTHYAKDRTASIDVVHTKKLLLMGIQRHGHKSENATWCQVVDNNGIICGLMLATLTRAYAIYNRLMATDLMFITNSMAGPKDAMQLLRNFVMWAERSPACIEVRCGATAIISDPERVGKLLRRAGMKSYGSIWKMDISK